MIPLTYVELFAGAGGLSRGLELAGWECLAHAEIEPHARAVLRHHWPDTPLFGDVSTLTGAMIREASGGRPVTMLTGGSPCQDLSIAGKRAGMTEGSGTRSSLYFHQVRLWEELGAPYFLWENVLGAFSSNNGRNFAAVLSALVGSPVPVPADGWRGGGGVVAGRTGVAAWRVLDCQYFGPPQRRRRVFVLGTRTGSVDPAEVLSLLESVSGHFEQSGEAGQGTSADVGRGPASGGGDAGHDSALTPWDSQSNRTDGSTGIYPSLQAGENSGQQRTGVFPIDTRNATRTTEADAQNRQGIGVGEGSPSSPTLTGLFVPAVYDARGNGAGSVDTTLPGDHLNRITDYTPVVMTQFGTVAGSLTARHDSSPCADRGQNIVYAVDKQSSHAERGTDRPTLRTDLAHDMGPVVMRQREGCAGGGKGPMLGAQSETLGTVNDQTVFTMASGQANAEIVNDGEPSLTNNHDGPPILFAVGGYAEYTQSRPTLGASGGDTGGGSEGIVVSPTLSQIAHPGSYNGQDGPQIAHAIQQAQGPTVRPRRLMPIECERLMGWPDRWTELGVPTMADHGATVMRQAAAQGGFYRLSNSARYKLCGNGVASPVAGWIAWRLRWAMEAQGG